MTGENGNAFVVYSYLVVWSYSGRPDHVGSEMSLGITVPFLLRP
jgi:hypothetical protein